MTKDSTSLSRPTAFEPCFVLLSSRNFRRLGEVIGFMEDVVIVRYRKQLSLFDRTTGLCVESTLAADMMGWCIALGDEGPDPTAN